MSCISIDSVVLHHVSREELIVDTQWQKVVKSAGRGRGRSAKEKREEKEQETTFLELTKSRFCFWLVANKLKRLTMVAAAGMK
jgi:hypothetical protein